MKTLNFKKSSDLLTEFALKNEEMLKVRGGDGDGIVKPDLPPIKI